MKMTLDKNRSTAIQLWVIGAILPIAFYFTGNPDQRDFAILWAAAKVVTSGNPADIYSPTITNVLADGMKWSEAAVFPYPPHATLLLLPFALLPTMPAYLLWCIVSAAFFYWAARPYIPPGLPAVLAVLTPASLICLDYGQTGLLLGALWLLAFRGKWAAVALLTFKPHLGFLSVLSIQDRTALIKIILLALALLGVCTLMFGMHIWSDFFAQVVGHGAKVGSTKRWLFQGVSPSYAYGFWGWIPFAVAGALLLARRVNVFTASTASFLITPFGFNYDMTVASLGFGLAVARHWNEMPVRDRLPIALCFLSPVIAIFGAWWVPPLLLWALWAQVQYDVDLPRS